MTDGAAAGLPQEGTGSQASPPGTSAAQLERENRRLTRRLARMEENVRRQEEFTDSNAALASRLLTELQEERERSRLLLLNVLPQRIIDRLEAGETLIADRHDAVTVLFSDFVGFTEVSARIPAATLIEELNALYTGFDAICDATGVEKIKTVGDAFLAIGGLAGEADHAAAVAEAALRMVELVERRGATSAPVEWRIRIGIHDGPVVAGVIGTSRFAYDVWGDTVNVAARLETASEPNRIHLSSALASRLEDRFVLEPRGTIDLKGKGSVDTCFLVGRREAARSAASRSTPPIPDHPSPPVAG